MVDGIHHLLYDRLTAQQSLSSGRDPMPHLSISALGPLVVTLDGQTVTALAYDKLWAVLGYPSHAADQPHRRESLAGLLGPDQPEEKARANLRQALVRLRKAIGDANATPPFLLVERTGSQLNPP